MDIIRLGMNINEHPKRISCCGGFYAYKETSDQEVPNLQVATFEYPNGAVLELEVRSLPTPNEPYSHLWLGTKGYAIIQNDVFQVFSGGRGPATAGGQTGTAAFATGATQDRTAKPSMQVTNADLEPNERFDAITKAGIDYHFQNFVDCVKDRKKENLVAEVESAHYSTAMMHLGNIAFRTGRKLDFDSKAEKFLNDKEANAYLSRPDGGRKPFNMPTTV